MSSKVITHGETRTPDEIANDYVNERNNHPADKDAKGVYVPFGPATGVEDTRNKEENNDGE